MLPKANSVTPLFVQVKIYFDQKGFEIEEAQQFFNEYSERDWKGKRGVPVKSWRAKALDWMWQKQKGKPYLRSRAKLF